MLFFVKIKLIILRSYSISFIITDANVLNGMLLNLFKPILFKAENYKLSRE